MSPRARWIILGLALIGLGFASASTWVHYKLLTDPTYVSPCDMSSRFNCSQVYLSQYGAVKGIPIALGGVLWFGLVALIAWFSKPSDDRQGRHPGGTYLFVLSTIGLAVVLYLGYTSWFVLKTVCILCAGTYVAVAGIFLTSGVSSPMSITQALGRLMSDIGAAFKEPLVPVLVLLLFGGTAYAAAVFPREIGHPPMDGQSQDSTALAPEQVKAFSEAWAQQPRVDPGVPADGAKVLIVKYNDYQCPGCAATHAWFKPILQKYEASDPGAIKYVVKDWPWNAKCNSNLTPGQPPEHPGTCEGAAAVRMARERGGKAKELEMQDYLFANLQSMTPATVKQAADRIVGVKDFDAEYAKQLVEIRKDVAQGTTLRITSTPTIFINGVRIEQIMPAAYFDLAIQLELKRTAGK
jgi:uncharacterized membrane protein/protein-disulfide isomerase